MEAKSALALLALEIWRSVRIIDYGCRGPRNIALRVGRDELELSLRLRAALAVCFATHGGGKRWRAKCVHQLLGVRGCSD